MDDLDLLRSFRYHIIDSLTDPDHYLPEEDETEFISSHLGEAGCSIGVFHHDTLVAYAALGLPLSAAECLSNLIGLKLDSDTVGHFSACMVERKWRGAGLQRLLVEARLRVAERQGRNNLLSIISPRNHFSWANLTAHGFHIHAIKQLYDGRARYILCRDFLSSQRFQEHQIVVASDLERQQALLTRGYVGIQRLVYHRDDPLLVMARPVDLQTAGEWPVIKRRPGDWGVSIEEALEPLAGGAFAV